MCEELKRKKRFLNRESEMVAHVAAAVAWTFFLKKIKKES
jgi:hypothetical protein